MSGEHLQRFSKMLYGQFGTKNPKAVPNQHVIGSGALSRTLHLLLEAVHCHAPY